MVIKIVWRQPEYQAQEYLHQAQEYLHQAQEYLHQAQVYDLASKELTCLQCLYKYLLDSERL